MVDLSLLQDSWCIRYPWAVLPTTTVTACPFLRRAAYLTMHPVTEGGAIHTEGEKEAEQTCPATCTSLQVIPNHEENSSKNPSVLGLHPLSYLMASEKPNGPSNLQKKRGGNVVFQNSMGASLLKNPQLRSKVRWIVHSSPIFVMPSVGNSSCWWVWQKLLSRTPPRNMREGPRWWKEGV